jgi:hypothetical protein
MMVKPTPARKRFPLSIRISLWLIIAAMLPLLLTLVVSQLQARSKLIDQANQALETDAQTHAQLIDTYLSQKLLVLKSLDYTPVVEDYLLDPVHNAAKDVPTIVANGRAIQATLDPDVTLVTFFSPEGKQLLYYSVGNIQPQPHGKYMIPPEDLQQFATGQQFVSGVYYDAATRQSTVELYTPVFSLTLKKLLGVVRDTLSIDTIWQIVNSEKGVNGSGSYAFILDQYGVRVVDPDPDVLFTSIAPLDVKTQQQAIDEQRYGKTRNVGVLADSTLSSIQSQKKPPVAFQEVPAGANESFQVTRRSLSSVPWTYFVLTPVNDVVAVANQQLLTIAVIAVAILLPAAVVGWFVGNRISSPISGSVASLVRNSEVLSHLSEREQNVSSEQLWMVEASKNGLKSQQYYTDAAQMAARRLNELGLNLLHQREVDSHTVYNTVSQMMSIGQYFEKALAYQDDANKKVAVAVKVTDEVAAQLASGAKSASEAANELDEIVQQLSNIVGK